MKNYNDTSAFLSNIQHIKPRYEENLEYILKCSYKPEAYIKSILKNNLLNDESIKKLINNIVESISIRKKQISASTELSTSTGSDIKFNFETFDNSKLKNVPMNFLNIIIQNIIIQSIDQIYEQNFTKIHKDDNIKYIYNIVIKLKILTSLCESFSKFNDVYHLYDWITDCIKENIKSNSKCNYIDNDDIARILDKIFSAFNIKNSIYDLEGCFIENFSECCNNMSKLQDILDELKDIFDIKCGDDDIPYKDKVCIILRKHNDRRSYVSCDNDGICVGKEHSDEEKILINHIDHFTIERLKGYFYEIISIVKTDSNESIIGAKDSIKRFCDVFNIVNSLISKIDDIPLGGSHETYNSSHNMSLDR
jgi:hypothetical protein